MAAASVFAPAGGGRDWGVGSRTRRGVSFFDARVLVVCLVAALFTGCARVEEAASHYDRSVEMVATTDGTGEVRYVITRRPAPDLTAGHEDGPSMLMDSELGGNLK